MKTSLVIPCTPSHFCTSLIEVLKSYENGTIKPDEVIVSLSQAPLVDKASLSRVVLQYLKKCASGNVFKEFTILSHIGKKTHGPNRQEGSNASTGDIILYNDADDIPHHQRVEAIKHCFETTDAMHINHWWCHESCKFASFDMKKIEIVKPEQVNSEMLDKYKHPLYPKVGYGCRFGRVHSGNTAIRKEVLQKVKWKDVKPGSEFAGAPAEDWLFCYEVAYNYRKSIILQLDLVKYCGDNADLLWNDPDWIFHNKEIKTIGAE